jgi:hypothetical protein
MATAVVSLVRTRGLHIPGHSVPTVLQPFRIEPKVQRILDLITPELQLDLLSGPQREYLRGEIQIQPSIRAEVDKRLAS